MIWQYLSVKFQSREGIPAQRTGRSKLPVSLSARTAMNLSRVIELARTAGTMAKKKSWKSSLRVRTNLTKKSGAQSAMAAHLFCRERIRALRL